jgi:integrase
MTSRNSAKLHRLDDMTIRRLVKAGENGWYNDGGNLYLKITGPGTASWVFRYKRYMGIGAYPLVTLAEAREEAHKLRKQLENGIDPLDHRDAARRQAELDKARAVTFDYCAKLWLDGKRKSCTSGYVNDLERRLRKYAYEKLEALPVKEIDTTLVLQVLEPIWTTVPVTANHWVRASLEEIFDLAKIRGFRDRGSENPARWTKHLEYSGLPAIGDFHAVVHRRMLPYAELPALMTALRNWDKQPGVIRRDGTLARCLQFMILTTTRPGEAAGARWDEIDFKNRVWTIPAERMKKRRAHSVPLSRQAMQVLDEQYERAISSPRLFTPLGRRIRAAMEAHPDFGCRRIARIAGSSIHMAQLIEQDLKSPPRPLREYVFDRRPQSKRQPGEGVRAGRIPFVTKLLRKAVLVPMEYGHVQPHGFRASFSTWVNEETDYPPELREFQLAHKVEDDTAAAYQRGTGLEKRRRMLQHYADYCDGSVTPKVVPLRSTGVQTHE